MEKILAVVWFFAFWGMVLADRKLFPWSEKTEGSGLFALLIIIGWFIVPVMMWNSGE